MAVSFGGLFSVVVGLTAEWWFQWCFSFSSKFDFSSEFDFSGEFDDDVGLVTEGFVTRRRTRRDGGGGVLVLLSHWVVAAVRARYRDLPCAHNEDDDRNESMDSGPTYITYTFAPNNKYNGGLDSEEAYPYTGVDGVCKYSSENAAIRVLETVNITMDVNHAVVAVGYGEENGVPYSL
ncbi:thiol protease aleurain-like protein [Tanacetum coccineum]